MGRLRSQQRHKEVEIMKYCFTKLGEELCCLWRKGKGGGGAGGRRTVREGCYGVPLGLVQVNCSMAGSANNVLHLPVLLQLQCCHQCWVQPRPPLVPQGACRGHLEPP
jgi:hypothetical protein